MADWTSTNRSPYRELPVTTNFLRDLDLLKKDLMGMGSKVEANIARAIHALVDRRGELADAVVEEDKAIDAIEVRIDAHCHHILALHQPVATDLRFILAVTKVNNELERMGDHARNIARAARELSRHEPIGIYEDLAKMGEACQSMVKRSLDALIAQDPELAQQVWDDDRHVDAAYQQTMADLIVVMQQNPVIVPQAMHAIRAARDLERIGDIATNIAKDVIFLVKGENVAHRHLHQGK